MAALCALFTLVLVACTGAPPATTGPQDATQVARPTATLTGCLLGTPVVRGRAGQRPPRSPGIGTPRPLATREGFTVGFGDFVSEGQLTAPSSGPGPFPTVVFISGSGPAHADDVAATYRDMVTMLVSNGYAAVSYTKRYTDRRGSRPSFDELQEYLERVPPRQLLADAERVYEAVRRHPKVDSTRIVLFGQSEGATIAPQVALAHPEVAGLVLHAARAETAKEGQAQFFLELGVPYLRQVADADHDGLLTLEELLRAQRAPHGEALDVLFGYLLDPSSPTASQRLRQDFDQDGDGRLDIEREFRVPLAHVLAHYDQYPEYRQRIAVDMPPLTATLPAYRGPILLQQGEFDAHVAVADTDRIAAALGASCHPDFSALVYPGLGHLLGPAPSRYLDMLVPVAAEPLADMAGWLNQRYANDRATTARGPGPTTPVPSPSPVRSSATTTAGIPGTPPGRVLFRDAFADANSGWPEAGDTNHRAAYERDGYRMAISAPGRWIEEVNPNVPPAADVYVEVDVTKVGGDDTPGNGYGVLCRYQDRRNYYVLRIFSYGGYGVYRMQGGYEHRLGGSAGLAHPAIRPGNARNHLRAECVGDTLRLIVNGQPVAEVRDDAPLLAPGRVALYACTCPNSGSAIDVVFANFVVRIP